jgi:hypothetical protein
MTSRTAEQLRDDIQSGRTGDKVNFPDPAAAPLGSDDEAAGQTPEPARVEASRAEEIAPKRLKEPFARRFEGADFSLVAAASLVAWGVGAALAVITAPGWS